MIKTLLTRFAPALLLVAIVVLAVFSQQILETNSRGQYQIKQAAVTGDMSARLEPGMYGQWFGDIDTWNKAETFYFTADFDGEGDTKADKSIEVRFNDGSIAKISGTARITLPYTEAEAVALVADHGYKSYKELAQKLVLPSVRNALRSSANLMSVRESYSENRLDFINWSRDQLQNGLYNTEEITKKVTDILSGEQVTRTFKTIQKDASGTPVYQFNPFDGKGITISNFEIKSFNYSPKVREQIAAQQAALMAVQTARALAKEAEQKALTTEAEGKAEVMRVKYENEQNKIAAIIKGEQRRDVAELAKAEAGFTKEAQILIADGEAYRKREVMAADGALDKKLAALVTINGAFAKAVENHVGAWVPSIVFGGGGSGGSSDLTNGMNGVQNMVDLLTLAAAKNLSLDMTLPTTSKTAVQ
jgi:regulator of protease activity HflC (stomatin/prohibitin superfamily)